MQDTKKQELRTLQGHPAVFICVLFAMFLALCLCSCAGTQSSAETDAQESNDQEIAASNDGEDEQNEAAESDEAATESNDGSAESADGESDASALDAASPESKDQEMVTVEDLPAVEDAEEETGILEADAGTSYAEGEVLVRLPKKVSIDEVNTELERLEFIEESVFTEDMLVSGEVQEDTIVYGAIGESVMKIHTADDVSVPQALMALEPSSVFLTPQPNYLMTASV